ncbi:hypothetical protein G9A89_019749 [Geosiphon pyriformis]|nr:hypothetical protein G9A89_019749 [Geosiphon pyriformis]
MSPREKLLIKLEKEKEKLIWEAYQVSWADEEHNELPPILSWDDNNKEKGKQKEELTWETDDLTWTDNNESKPTPPKPPPLITPTLYHNNLPIKLSSMGTCCGDNEEYHTATKFYCRPYLFERFGRPKRQGKWDNQPCFACGETLLDEGMWNNIPGYRGTCDPGEEPCSNWTVVYMTMMKFEAMPEEIKTIKDNPPEPLELDWDAELIINLLDPEQFYEHYQELASTREEQKQRLEQLNARLCQHCLIPCDVQYCNKCDLIYNPPPRMIYSIPEEEKPISSCASESESPINHNSNSDNNDNNNDSDSKPDVNYEQYIALSDLSKEQELK